MTRQAATALGLGLLLLLAYATIAGALYLAWAGLDPLAARPWTLPLYARAYGDWPGEGLRLGLSAALPLFGAGLVWLWLASGPDRQPYGKARFAGWRDLSAAGLFSASGLYLGRASGRSLRSDADGHLLVVGPTGEGKTSGLVIPTLLEWPGSVVVFDPKLESHAASAGWRAALGEVLVFNPLDAQGRSARINFLDQIAEEPSRRLTEMAGLAAALIPAPEGENRWVAQSARRFLTALGLWALDTPGADRSLGGVWRRLAGLPQVGAWCADEAKHNSALQEACRAGLIAFARAEAKEQAYVLSELDSALASFANPQVRAATEVSDFRFASLRRRPTSLYLGFSPADANAHGGLLRLLFEQAAATLLRAPPGQDEPVPVLLLIDEFASFGRLPMIETLMAAVRGYNARIMIACQALSQVDHLYGESGRNALIGNARTQIFMANPDPATAAHVSRLAGPATVTVESVALGSGRSPRRATRSPVGRPLITPAALASLPRGQAFLFTQGGPPARVRLAPFQQIARFARRLRQAPDIPLLRPPLPPPGPPAIAPGSAPQRQSGRALPSPLQSGAGPRPRQGQPRQTELPLEAPGPRQAILAPVREAEGAVGAALQEVVAAPQPAEPSTSSPLPAEAPPTSPRLAPPEPQPDEAPLNTKAAAAFLGKSERQLERMRHDPDGPPWKRVGARYDYYPSQLEWWRRGGGG